MLLPWQAVVRRAFFFSAAYPEICRIIFDRRPPVFEDLAHEVDGRSRLRCRRTSRDGEGIERRTTRRSAHSSKPDTLTVGIGAPGSDRAPHTDGGLDAGGGPVRDGNGIEYRYPANQSPFVRQNY